MKRRRTVAARSLVVSQQGRLPTRTRTHTHTRARTHTTQVVRSVEGPESRPRRARIGSAPHSNTRSGGEGRRCNALHSIRVQNTDYSVINTSLNLQSSLRPGPGSTPGRAGTGSEACLVSRASRSARSEVTPGARCGRRAITLDAADVDDHFFFGRAPHSCVHAHAHARQSDQDLAYRE